MHVKIQILRDDGVLMRETIFPINGGICAENFIQDPIIDKNGMELRGYEFHPYFYFQPEKKLDNEQ